MVKQRGFGRDEGKIYSALQVMLIVGIAAVIGTVQYYFSGSECFSSGRSMGVWLTEVDSSLSQDRDCRRIGYVFLLGAILSVTGAAGMFFSDGGSKELT